MHLHLSILASGSAGNCSVLRCPSGAILIDAGIGPRMAARRMEGLGVCIADVRAIVLTHLDRDHFSPTWAATIVARQIDLHCAAHRVDDLVRIVQASQWMPTERELSALIERIKPFESPGVFSPIAELCCDPISLAHDREGSHGFIIDGFAQRIGYATDLGRVPGELLRRWCERSLDILAIESNYDPAMQESSARPPFLKQRIMGGRGHLSNEQAMRAVVKVLDDCQRRRAALPAHVVLLHRSRECNCPKLLRSTFEADERLRSRLTLAEQFQPTPWLTAASRDVARAPFVGEQLSIAFA